MSWDVADEGVSVVCLLRVVPMEYKLWLDDEHSFPWPSPWVYLNAYPSPWNRYFVYLKRSLCNWTGAWTDLSDYPTLLAKGSSSLIATSCIVEVVNNMEKGYKKMTSHLMHVTFNYTCSTYIYNRCKVVFLCLWIPALFLYFFFHPYT